MRKVNSMVVANLFISPNEMGGYLFFWESLVYITEQVGFSDGSIKEQYNF